MESAPGKPTVTLDMPCHVTEETKEELKAKKNMETSAEAEETKRLELQVKQEVEKFLVAEETERQAEAMGDTNETKKNKHTLDDSVGITFFF